MTDSDHLVGAYIGRYHVLERLGVGGMAVVYKAYDTRLERYVALKLLRTERLDSRKAAKRFEIEAKALAQLNHPNIVQVLDYGEYEGTPYLVMEYVPGRTLKRFLGKPMPWQQAARLLAPIAHALAYAHERKIVHRDIKPSNILIAEDGKPMLSDFGVAKMLEPDETLDLTGTQVGVGTPWYMSPEQGMGKPVDQRTDVYALGVVFYELVTGRKPYHADTPMAVVVQHINNPLPRPKKFVSSLPGHVEGVIFKALAKSPADRFQEMADFAATLDKLAQGQKVRTILPPETMHLLLRVSGVLVIIVLLAFGVSSLSGRVRFDTGATSTIDLAYAATLQAKATLAVRETQAAEKTNQVLQMTEQVRQTQSAQETSTSVVRRTAEARLAQTESASRTQSAVVLPTPSNTIAVTATPVAPTSTLTFTITPTSTYSVTPTLTYTHTPTPIGPIQVSSVDGMELAFVPAGEFLMGSDEWVDEQPVHIVMVDAFWMDRTEVTNGMYALCVADGACEQPGSGSIYSNPANENKPVVAVRWRDAYAYCRWAGRRLPTEAEWEKAARGGLESKKYPWGDQDPVCTPGAFNGAYYGECGSTSAADVGLFAPNRYGLYDMAGNVWEWTSTAFRNYPYSANDGRESIYSDEQRVLRGGSWENSAWNLRTSYRNRVNPASLAYDIGFRCALDGAP